MMTFFEALCEELEFRALNAKSKEAREALQSAKHAIEDVIKRDVEPPIPAYIIDYLDKLNSHARTWGGPMSTERNAIYAYKGWATMYLAQRSEITARCVKWTGPCRTCGGTGKFTEYWANEKTISRCRRCYGLGKVTLRFTETKLPTGQVWHHPWEGQSTPGFDVARQMLGRCDGSFYSDSYKWEETGEWAPSMEGRKLPPWLLFPFMTGVEMWVLGTATVGRGEPYCWYQESAARAILNYRMDIGEEPPDGCIVCGAPSEGCRIGHVTQFIHWTVRSCAAHRDQALAMKESPPASMISTHVAEWLDRRNARQRVTT